MPGQARAFYPGREIPHPGQRLQLAQPCARVLAAEHRLDTVRRVQRLGLGVSGYRLGQQRRRSHRNGAAAALERGVSYLTVLDAEVEMQLVAAQRIYPFRFVRVALRPPEVTRAPGMVQDQLPVQLPQLPGRGLRHGQPPKISFARPSAVTSRSTSSRLL